MNADRMVPMRRALLLLIALAAPGSCAKGANNGLVITSPTSWINQTVTINGTLTIASGGCLSVTDSTILFNPAVEDTGSFVIQGNGCLNVVRSTLQSGNGKQWYLVVQDAGSVSFSQSSKATNHSGLRFLNASTLTSDHSTIEEIQVHDNAALTIRNGSSAYVVAFFGGPGTQTFGPGAFDAGTGLNRNLAINTGPGTTGTVAISNSDISGFQLDLQDAFDLSIAASSGVVLALHLANYVNPDFTANITSSAATSGIADFSASANPKFTWNNCQIASVNLYLSKASKLSWNGRTSMTEVNAADTSALTLNSGVSLWANLAQTYQFATMTLNSVTLLQDSVTHPSFTAMDHSVININNTNATPQTTVYQVDSGKVNINGGTGW